MRIVENQTCHQCSHPCRRLVEIGDKTAQPLRFCLNCVSAAISLFATDAIKGDKAQLSADYLKNVQAEARKDGAAQEREECAKLAEEWNAGPGSGSSGTTQRAIAEAIRARQ